MKITASNNRLIPFYDNLEDQEHYRCKAVNSFVPLKFKLIDDYIFQLIFETAPSPALTNANIIDVETGLSASPLPLTTSTHSINGVVCTIVHYNNTPIVLSAGLYYINIESGKYYSEVFEITACDPDYILQFENPDCKSLIGADIGTECHVQRVEIFENTFINDVAEPKTVLVEKENGLGDSLVVHSLNKSRKKISFVANSSAYECMMLLSKNFSLVTLYEETSSETITITDVEVTVNGDLNQCNIIVYEVVFSTSSVENCKDCTENFPAQCNFNYTVSCDETHPYFIVQSEGNFIEISTDDVSYFEQGVAYILITDATWYFRLTCVDLSEVKYQIDIDTGDPCNQGLWTITAL